MQIALNAQLLNTSHSYRGAGVSNYCRQLLAHLGALPSADHCFTAFVNPATPPIAGIHLQHTTLPVHHPLPRIVWEQTLFPLALQQQHFGLVHGLVNVLPLTARIPGVVTVHDLSFLRMPDKFLPAKRWYLTQLCRASVAKARHIIAVSRQTAEDLHHFWQVETNKISVIYNGVSAEFTPAPPAHVETFRRQRGLPARFFLYLGTLEPRKNLPLLLRAYARWRAQLRGASGHENQAIHLVIAGAKGWFYEQIFALVTELHLEKAVLFPGYIPNDELPDWYRAADAFVYPSLFEGFGLPVLEAMACGVPVICSDTGSLVEVAGDQALIFPADDEAALVECFHQIANDHTLRQELARASLVRAQHFSWQQAASATLALYDMLAP
ncbi:MAG: glycosyltransferase family 1 protein [Caldilineaceae bacterium]